MQPGVAFIYSLKTWGNRKPTPGCNGLNFRIRFLRIKCYSESSKIDSSLLWIKYLQSKNSNWNKDELEIMKAENAAHIKDPSSMLQLIPRFHDCLHCQEVCLQSGMSSIVVVIQTYSECFLPKLSQNFKNFFNH